MTKLVSKNGQLMRSPELEEKYGVPIPLRRVDTGGAFHYKGFGA